jgi:hypothetical protein
MRRLMSALVMLVLIFVVPGAAVQASVGAQGTGWVRLAHLCPDTPMVDVYLYNFGDPHARLELHRVGLGVISPYLALPAGEYTVAIREVGTAQPAVSTALWVQGGMMYTIAGIGESRRTTLAVLDDTFKPSRGQVLVRVLSASLGQQRITVRAGKTTIGQNLTFAHTSPYRTVPPGPLSVVATGTTSRVVAHLTLTANSIHTLIVVDGKSGPEITDLTDAVGVQAVPRGGAATGLGGAAPRPDPSPLSWLMLIIAGALIALAGAARYARPVR